MEPAAQPEVSPQDPALAHAAVVEPHPDGWFVTHDATLEGGDVGNSWHQGIKLASQAVLEKKGGGNTAFVYDSSSGRLLAKPAGRHAKWAGKEEDMPYNLFLWGKDTGRRVGDKILIALKDMEFSISDGSDGQTIKGVNTPDEARDHVIRRQRMDRAALWLPEPVYSLTELPKERGSIWQKCLAPEAMLYVWVDRFVGRSQFDFAKAQVASAPLFAAFDGGSKEAADSLSDSAEGEGNEAVVFGLCCRLVPSWSVEDEAASVEEFFGGQSGARTFKVQRCAKGEHDVVLFRICGEGGGAGKAAAEALTSSSTYFPTIWVHELLDRLVVLEWIAGGVIEKGVPRSAVALQTSEDAVALGTVVAKFHSDHGWYDKYMGNKDPLDETRQEIERSEHGHAMMEALRVGRSDDMVGIYRSACTFGLTSLCKVLPRVASLLPPDSLLGRTVVVHLDLHDHNLMRREAGHRPGDLVLLDFDRVCYAQATSDFGLYLSRILPKMFEKATGTPYPTLDNRKACAQAYINALPQEVLAQCSRTSVEEVVLDMEAGTILADARSCTEVMEDLPKELGVKAVSRVVEERLEKTLACWEKAKSDPDLKDRILREGLEAATGGLVSAQKIIMSELGAA